MKKIFFLVAFLFSQFSAASDFTNLVKRTSSVYSGSLDIDNRNPGKIYFESTMDNQKVFLQLSATHLNTTFATVVNTSPELKKKIMPDPPIINVYNLKLEVDEDTLSTAIDCTGEDIGPTDTSCNEKKCNLTQRVISACNEHDCWKQNPATDRLLNDPLSGSFYLHDKVDVTKCIPDHLAGMKHSLSMSVTNVSSSAFSGGTINYALILKNESLGVTK